MEVSAAKTRELVAWGKFQVLSPLSSGKVSKDVVDTYRVFTWKDVEGEGPVRASLVARGFQDPAFVGGLADISSCVSPRSSCLQVVPLRALKKWSLWSSDTQYAPLGVDPSPREALSSCLWWLITPAYGLNVARVATRIHTTLQCYSV